jgi:hypothetical protein
MQRGVAAACIERCMQLGYTRYNAVLRESFTFVQRDWMNAEKIAAWLRALPQSANSGDIYARLPG